jgi:hypothetical protein
MNAKNWNNLLPEPLGEREKSPRTLRFPIELAEKIEALAAESGQEFTSTTLYLLKAAVAEVEASRNGKKLRAG